MDTHDLLHLFVQYGYLLVFFLVLLDNAALSLPGELVLLGTRAPGSPHAVSNRQGNH